MANRIQAIGGIDFLPGSDGAPVPGGGVRLTNDEQGLNVTTDGETFTPLATTALATKTAAGLLPSTGVPVGLLPGSLFKSFCTLGADASGGATHITATGVKVGDKVVMVANVTDHASAAVDFEATVTVADQIQQTAANLSAKTLVILVIAQS